MLVKKLGVLVKRVRVEFYIIDPTCRDVVRNSKMIKKVFLTFSFFCRTEKSGKKKGEKRRVNSYFSWPKQKRVVRKPKVVFFSNPISTANKI